MRWFKNLKKWQKGGLIGCGVGLIFACLLMLSKTLDLEEIVWKWITELHMWLYVIFWRIIPLRPYIMGYYATAGAIVVFYGVLGILVGRVQQMASPIWKWLLTALLALFLLLFYGLSVFLAMWWEHA